MQTDQHPFAIDWVELRRQRKRLTPAQLIAVSFALAILIGTILLALPIAHAPDQRVGVLDAFFTATSAVCVTGLIVVDTGAALGIHVKRDSRGVPLWSPAAGRYKALPLRVISVPS